MMKRLDKLQSALFWPVVSIYVGLAILEYVFPASFWFEVRSVIVHDAIVGSMPKISYSRSIYHDFNGQWNVVIKKVADPAPDGHFYGVCEAQGPAHGRVRNIVPPNLDLLDWTFPTKCELGEGLYVMETVWNWTGFGFDRSVSFTSPPFKIYPVGTDPSILK